MLCYGGITSFRWSKKEKQQSVIFRSHGLPQINSPPAGGNIDHEHTNAANWPQNSLVKVSYL